MGVGGQCCTFKSLSYFKLKTISLRDALQSFTCTINLFWSYYFKPFFIFPPKIEIFIVWFKCMLYFNRFEDDIQYMLGFRPHMYWRICWRYVSPALIVIITIASIINLAINPMTYSAWDMENVSYWILLVSSIIYCTVMSHFSACSLF